MTTHVIPFLSKHLKKKKKHVNLMSTYQVTSEENQSFVQSFTSYCLWS